MSGRLHARGAAAARAEVVGDEPAAQLAEDGRVRLVGWGECG